MEKIENLIENNESFVYVVSDENAFYAIGNKAIDAGYKLQTFNLFEPKISTKYNPFAYVKSEQDILFLAEKLAGGNDSVKLFLSALIGYVLHEVPESERNIEALINMMNYVSSAREVQSGRLSEVDLLFEDLAKQSPQCFAVRQYKNHKKAPAYEESTVYHQCAVALSKFDFDVMKTLTEKDELDLVNLPDGAKALFVKLSEHDRSFDCIADILFWQIACETPYIPLIFEDGITEKREKMKWGELKCRL